MELAEAGVDFNGYRYPLEKTYLEAYENARNAALAQMQDVSEKELIEIGRDAGMARIVERFLNGEIESSGTQTPYNEIYADRWNRQQQFKAQEQAQEQLNQQPSTGLNISSEILVLVVISFFSLPVAITFTRREG
jgi:hypothetical protein